VEHGGCGTLGLREAREVGARRRAADVQPLGGAQRERAEILRGGERRQREPGDHRHAAAAVAGRYPYDSGADSRQGDVPEVPVDRPEGGARGRGGQERRQQREKDEWAAQRLPRVSEGGVDSPAVARPFAGKRALVLGVANKRSIAWAIAKRLHAGGAELAFTFQGERIEKSVRDLAATVDAKLVTECDVRSDDDVARVFSEVADAFGGKLDILVHSVAYAAAEDLEGRFTDTPRDRFWMALDVSAYSLVACARAAEPLLEAAGGGSIVTMTYLGGERAVPHYNVMGVAKATLDSSVKYLAWELGEKGIRVNAISAGPVRTLAARSIAGFPTMEAIVEERAPLHRHVDADDVGGAAAYLLSDDAKNVTGTTLYVDSGYHAMGM